MENSKPNWRFCVVGNIAKTHFDDEGILRYGTKAFSGGAKVYLCGRFWNKDIKFIDVLGCNRQGRYEVEYISVDLIENVRASRTYKAKVMDIMNDFEFHDLWWQDSQEDRNDITRFLNEWNSK